MAADRLQQAIDPAVLHVGQASAAGIGFWCDLRSPELFQSSFFGNRIHVHVSSTLFLPDRKFSCDDGVLQMGSMEDSGVQVCTLQRSAILFGVRNLREYQITASEHWTLSAIPVQHSGIPLLGAGSAQCHGSIRQPNPELGSQGRRMRKAPHHQIMNDLAIYQYSADRTKQLTSSHAINYVMIEWVYKIFTSLINLFDAKWAHHYKVSECSSLYLTKILRSINGLSKQNEDRA